MRETGKVYLVGAGPGDPELLTLKASRLLSEADVVVYDRLIGEAILDLVPAGIPRIFVGKASGRHSMAQEQINELLAGLAGGRRRVVRLKGGDPFVFGRGSEEALYLRRRGIPFEVVPGVTAAAACAAYAGVPLTHRGLSRGVRLVTGHFRDDEPIDLDWAGLVEPDTTLVIYMGLGTLQRISAGLLGAGMDPAMPAVAIQDGTLAGQRRVFGEISNLAERVVAAGLRPPALIVIGPTVCLAGELGWFGESWESPHAAMDDVALF